VFNQVLGGGMQAKCEAHDSMPQPLVLSAMLRPASGLGVDTDTGEVRMQSVWHRPRFSAFH
jgi:hypothetical protein